MVTRRGHSPLAVLSRSRRAGSRTFAGGARGGHPAARASAILTPRRSRTSRASSERLVAAEASAAAGGCRRHATSGASTRACPRRELPSEGPSFDSDRRRRARGSSARAPTRFLSVDVRREELWPRREGVLVRRFAFLRDTGIRRRGRKKNPSTRVGATRSRRLRSYRVVFVQRRRSCARGKYLLPPPPRLRTRGAATPGSPCARRRSCRRTISALCRSSRRPGWCSRPWGSSSAAPRCRTPSRTSRRTPRPPPWTRSSPRS